MPSSHLLRKVKLEAIDGKQMRASQKGKDKKRKEWNNKMEMIVIR